VSAVRVAARLLTERAQVHLSDGMRERLASCVDREARAAGQTAERYAAGLAADPAAFQRLLDCVTVQETAFFRHPDQFLALERHVLPSLAPPVTVWSAGCANGQEAYSLAMVLADAGCPDWQVLATDISAAAVARARAGRYTEAELDGIPPARRRWLRPAGDGWEVDPALRRRVRVERLNLTGRFPCPPGRCQVVFCRNVLFYLARAEAAAFLERLAGWLAPGGVVFLGYSETITASSGRLQVERLGEAYALRQVPQAPAPPPRPVPAPLPAWSAPTAPPGEAEEALAMVAAGEAAAARGDLDTAVGAFRKAAYLDPDHPIAHFQLGLALDASGHPRGARRAYAAALGALGRADPGSVEAGLEGWRAGELAAALRARLREPRPEPGP
jgi:chemotaxis methyl-accepting protein methylase